MGISLGIRIKEKIEEESNEVSGQEEKKENLCPKIVINVRIRVRQCIILKFEKWVAMVGHVLVRIL